MPKTAIGASEAVTVAEEVPFTVELLWPLLAMGICSIPPLNSPCSRACGGKALSATPVLYNPSALSINAFATTPATVLGLKPVLPVVENLVSRLGNGSGAGPRSASPIVSPNAVPKAACRGVTPAGTAAASSPENLGAQNSTWL